VYTSLHQDILAWYQNYGRHDLPWRKTSDPYAIYVSEIMLQQTQVQTVLDRFYAPFLEQFPTFKALSQASEEKVLKAWEGLGYYSRARNLHRASIEAGGEVPKDKEGLLALPGIGVNTAHAILAFAYHRPVPVLEANVRRVLTRFFAKEEPGDKHLWELAEQLLDREHPFEYNQAMMDIGSYICTKDPQCERCPLSQKCQGKEAPERYRVKCPKVTQKTRQEHIVVVYSKAQGFYMCRRQDQKLLQGMYGFVSVDEKELGEVDASPIGEVAHVYSHFKLQAKVYLASQLPVAWAKKIHGEWIGKQGVLELPLSGVDRKILQKVATHIG